MALTVIASEQAPKAIGPYSQAIQVGNLLFTSGQIPLNLEGNVVQGGIDEQTRQVFANLQAVLAEAGCQFSDVVKATVFMKDMNDFAAMNAIYGEVFGNHKPARSAVEVARLPRDVAVEIEVIAQIPVK